MNKKVLSLVLALVIVLGSFGTVAMAADPLSTQDQKIQWLVDNEVVAGRKVNADGSADLALNEFLTRAEVTKLVVYTLKQQNLADALKGVMQPFPDVALDHWANGYISVATTQRADIANGRRIVIGYPDGKFYPNNNVTYAELATMLVRIVKKDLTDAMEKNAIWATSYMRWAEEEGILKGLTIADSNKPVPRRDAFEMIYNAMFQLKLDNYNAPKFGDVMGIVSKAQAGVIQLNQDSKLEYKITFNSRVTDGTTWGEIAQNANLPGSLVRVIANEQGEILYLIELGSPREGAIEGRWFEVADKTAETRDFGPNAKAVAGDAYFFDEYFKKINVDGKQATIDAKTRFFVADVDKNALKEVKTLDEVFRYYIRDYKDLNKVYMGYDSFQGRNEAKVIVFGEVDKYMGGTAIRRVTNYYSTRYHIAAEDTKGAVQTYNLADTIYFPRSKYVDKLDVIKLYLDGDNYSQSERGSNKGLGYDLLIDYSEDPVYEVSAVNLGDRYIELKDEYGYARRFYIKDADVFLEGQAKKGAHVQVVFANNNADVEVVSVVDKKLEGALPTGVRVGMEQGWIVRYETLADGRMTITIAGENLAKAGQTPIYRNLKSYEVATDWQAAVRALGVNARIVFDVNDKFGATPYIYNVEEWSDKDVQPGTGNLPTIKIVNATGISQDGIKVGGEYVEGTKIDIVKNTVKELPRYSDVLVTAPLTSSGQVLKRFEITGVVTNRLDDVAKGQVSFKMPETGHVEVTAIYGDVVVTDARVSNNGDCDLQIVAVNGVELAEAVEVPVDGTVRSYPNPKAGVNEPNEPATLNFKTGDRVIVQLLNQDEDGICGTEECKLVGFNVAKTCAAGNTVNAGTIPFTTVNPGPCGGSTCVEIPCAAELELSCLTEIAAVGKSDVKTESASVVTVQKLAAGTYSFAKVNEDYFDVTVDIVGGKLVGKVVLTEAGKSAKVEIVKVQVTETDTQDHILDADEDFVVGAAFSVNLNACTDLCNFVVEINVQYTESCPPCEQRV